MADARCNALSLDVDACMDGIRKHLLLHLGKAEEKLIALMEREVLKTTHGLAPGKPEWRKDLQERIGVVNERVTDSLLEAEVGVDTNMLFTDFVKAMIITYGSGNKVGNGSIEAGPYGREVWDDNVDGKKSSTAEGNYLLPDEFNQRGNRFIDNAVALMKKHYDDILEDALATLPDSLFYGNVRVTPRR